MNKHRLFSGAAPWRDYRTTGASAHATSSAASVPVAPDSGGIVPLSADAAEKQFLASLCDDLKHQRLTMPTLPEVARLARQPAVNADELAAELTRIATAEPPLAARAVRMVNSVLLRDQSPVASVPTAIERTGVRRVHNLMCCLVMEPVWRRQASPLIDDRLLELWRHGTQVAALCAVIARKFTALEPDQAMFAGLIHDIGALPILGSAVNAPEILANDAAMRRINERLHPRIGKMVLQAWQFPSALLDVVAAHENLDYDSHAGPDLVDIVIVANLHSYIGTTVHSSNLNWELVPAFGKIGLTPQASIAAVIEARDEIAEIRSLLTA